MRLCDEAKLAAEINSTYVTRLLEEFFAVLYVGRLVVLGLMAL